MRRRPSRTGPGPGSPGASLAEMLQGAGRAGARTCFRASTCTPARARPLPPKAAQIQHHTHNTPPHTHTVTVDLAGRPCARRAKRWRGCALPRSGRQCVHGAWCAPPNQTPPARTYTKAMGRLSARCSGDGACLGVAHPILSLAPKHIDQLGQLPKLPSGILPASEMASKMPRI